LSQPEIKASYNAKVNPLTTTFTGLANGNYEYYAYAVDIFGNSTKTQNRALNVGSTVGYAAWDINMDNNVNILDIILIGQHWGETGSLGWIRQDVNADGVVNVLDSIIVGQHWTS
jgi:hypothetical protein